METLPSIQHKFYASHKQNTYLVDRIVSIAKYLGLRVRTNVTSLHKFDGYWRYVILDPSVGVNSYSINSKACVYYSEARYSKAGNPSIVGERKALRSLLDFFEKKYNISCVYDGDGISIVNDKGKETLEILFDRDKASPEVLECFRKHMLIGDYELRIKEVPGDFLPNLFQEVLELSSNGFIHIDYDNSGDCRHTYFIEYVDFEEGIGLDEPGYEYMDYVTKLEADELWKNGRITLKKCYPNNY